MVEVTLRSSCNCSARLQSRLSCCLLQKSIKCAQGAVLRAEQPDDIARIEIPCTRNRGETAAGGCSHHVHLALCLAHIILTTTPCWLIPFSHSRASPTMHSRASPIIDSRWQYRFVHELKRVSASATFIAVGGGGQGVRNLRRASVAATSSSSRLLVVAAATTSSRSC